MSGKTGTSKQDWIYMNLGCIVVDQEVIFYNFISIEIVPIFPFICTLHFPAYLSLPPCKLFSFLVLWSSKYPCYYLALFLSLQVIHHLKHRSPYLIYYFFFISLHEKSSQGHQLLCFENIQVKYTLWWLTSNLEDLHLPSDSGFPTRFRKHEEEKHCYVYAKGSNISEYVLFHINSLFCTNMICAFRFPWIFDIK
jgi:hypothetical protein